MIRASGHQEAKSFFYRTSDVPRNLEHSEGERFTLPGSFLKLIILIAQRTVI